MAGQVRTSDLVDGQVTGVKTSSEVAKYADATPTFTAAQLKAKRLSHNGATALVVGDFALGAGWGTTAAASSPLGTDGAFSVTITANGASIAANPTVTLTFKDLTWTNSPIVIAGHGGGSGTAALWSVSAVTATTVTFVYNGTPVAGSTYILNAHCIGR